MQTFQFVPVSRQRIEELFLIEALRHFKVLVLARHRIQVGKHFAHAAKFCAENTLHVFVTE